MNIYNFLKNTEAFKNFFKAYKLGKHSHGYIVTSEDKFALSAFTKLMATTLICKKPLAPCLQCLDCKRILNDNHPDVLIRPESGEKVKVADIDFITEASSYRPIESDKRVFIINTCESMNQQSQNKLLKTLEEPPEGTTIILSAEGKSNFLPTILSRCQTIDIGFFTAEKIAEYLLIVHLESGISPDRANVISVTCGGSLTRAQQMVENPDILEMQDYVYNLGLNLNKLSDCANIVETLDKFTDKQELMRTVQLFLRDSLMLSTGLDNTIVNKQAIGQLRAFVKRTDMATITLHLDKVNDIMQRLSVNCIFSTAFEPFILSLYTSLNS